VTSASFDNCLLSTLCRGELVQRCMPCRHRDTSLCRRFPPREYPQFRRRKHRYAADFHKSFHDVAEQACGNVYRPETSGLPVFQPRCKIGGHGRFKGHTSRNAKVFGSRGYSKAPQKDWYGEDYLPHLKRDRRLTREATPCPCDHDQVASWSCTGIRGRRRWRRGG
jgi:hypothetical protein